MSKSPGQHCFTQKTRRSGRRDGLAGWVVPLAPGDASGPVWYPALIKGGQESHSGTGLRSAGSVQGLRRGLGAMSPSPSRKGTLFPSDLLAWASGAWKGRAVRANSAASP